MKESRFHGVTQLDVVNTSFDSDRTAHLRSLRYGVLNGAKKKPVLDVLRPDFGKLAQVNTVVSCRKVSRLCKALLRDRDCPGSSELLLLRRQLFNPCILCFTAPLPALNGDQDIYGSQFEP